MKRYSTKQVCHTQKSLEYPCFKTYQTGFLETNFFQLRHTWLFQNGGYYGCRYFRSLFLYPAQGREGYLVFIGLYSLFIPLFPLSFSAGVRVCLSLIQRVNMDKEEKTNVGIVMHGFLFILCSYRVNIQQ